eukprot:gene20253-22237_t
MIEEEIEKQLEEEFCDVGIDIEGNLIFLEKLRNMCTSFNLEPSELLAKWFTYSALHNDTDLTMGVIDDFGKGVGKRLHTTPEDVKNKRLANQARTPAAKIFASSATFSPMSIATPSPKYEGRKNKGDIIVSYPDARNEKWQGTGIPLTIEPFDKDVDLKKSYKYMSQKISSKVEVLTGMINTISENMKDAFSLDDSVSLLNKTQNVVTASGRICCDSVGRLNSKSIILEGCRRLSNGARIRLNVDKCPNYSLFPGQVVTVKGFKSEDTFTVHELHDGVRLPFCSAFNKENYVKEDNFVVYVTCGPYATSDMLSHAPLTDFLKIVEDERPDLVVMLGPFVDSKQPSIEKADVDFAFEDKFTEYKGMIMATAISSESKIAFVPAQRDIFHDQVYPQPPFEMFEKMPDNIKEKILSLSDPSTMMINDVVFGITSTDILFHLGAEEISSFAPGTSDRLGRHVAHILKQQSYYPLNPPSSDVNINYLHYQQYCSMPISPDILILPSDIRCFVKEVESCLCINPGRLVKGHTGGTFAKIMVKPSKVPNTDKSVATDSFVQIVKI